jgi:hypothetical protein
LAVDHFGLPRKVPSNRRRRLVFLRPKPAIVITRPVSVQLKRVHDQIRG